MHNVAVAATVNNTVYAFDADNGNIFWSKNFTPPA
jgi:outer membrane protein assembly factor BamB